MAEPMNTWCPASSWPALTHGWPWHKAGHDDAGEREAANG
jgi:hypothetical protein